MEKDTIEDKIKFFIIIISLLAFIAMIIAIIVDEPKPKYEYTLVYRIHYSNYYKEYVAKSDEEIEYGYSFWRYTINSHIHYYYKGKAPFEIISYTKKEIN